MRALIFALCLVAPSAFAMTAPATPPDVTGRDTGIGTVFTTAAGRSLYVYDKDTKAGESTCVGKCAEAWPPLLASAGAAPGGDWTLLTRTDGGQQWAFRGRPLYTFAKDDMAGATLGDGVQDIWHIAVALAPRPRGVVFQGTIAGRVAANGKGLTLYAADKDCTGTCLDTWSPFKAAWTANGIGDWSVVKRKDDATGQWAYRGKAVYTFNGDTAPGSLAGDGKDGAWHAVVLQPIPPLPSWVKVQVSDYGPIFADSHGMTIYTPSGDMAEIKRALCNDACLAANWSPVLADPASKPTGNWGIVDGPEGRQWTYRGQAVYTFKNDKKPSDIAGDRFAIGAGFGGFRVLTQKALAEEKF